jgi:hypothetical protein
MLKTCFQSAKEVNSRLLVGLAAFGVLATFVRLAAAQVNTGSGDAVALVQRAVDSELQAEKNDKSLWKYRDRSSEAGKNKVAAAVETPQGELEKTVAVDGRPLEGEAEKQECERIRQFVNDAAQQAKVRKNEAHDNAQATAFLKMLPTAFVWTVVSQTSETVTLRYEPNPAFQPPTMEARVLGAMAGEMVVALPDDRIQSLHGKLIHDVKFGYGLLGKMDAGGTFDVERRQVAPGHWDITESHVHIGGHALLFHSIGQNSDEVKTDWAPSPYTSLAAAARDLGVETAGVQ